MNFTLSIDRELLEKSREIARRKHTSVSSLVIEFLKKLVYENDPRHPGRSFEEMKVGQYYSGIRS